MSVALVTGASGFLGRYVCRELSARDVEVVRLSRHKSSGPDSTIVIPERPTVKELAEILDNVKPDIVYHLAGTSRAAVAELYQANVLFAEALLQGATASSSHPKVLLVGSAAEYGKPIRSSMTVRETDTCRPNSAYGISKLAQTHHGQAAVERGLDVTIARLFNPVGVGSPATTALGSFVRQIAAMGMSGGVLRTSGLESVRDFLEVCAAARAIVELPTVRTASGGIYNVCTGIGTRLRNVVAELINVSGVPITHELEQSRRGTSDIDVVIGDNSRLHEVGIHIEAPDFGRVLGEMLAEERSIRREANP